jgi:hypothetical protein
MTGKPEVTTVEAKIRQSSGLPTIRKLLNLSPFRESNPNCVFEAR